MPPYASQQEIFGDHDDLNLYNDVLVDVPLGPKPHDGTTTDSNSNNNSIDDTATTSAKPPIDSEGAESENPSSSILERLLDFNPCTVMIGGACSFPNPSSAIFKDRHCSECGGKCTKMQGYTKEIVETCIVDEETGEESVSKTKIYFHKWCAQIRDYRQEHKKDFQAVMCNLMDYFRARELEAQIKRESELRSIWKQKQQQQQQREEEARNKENESDRAAPEELVKKADGGARASLLLEVNWAKKTRGFLKRVKKSGIRIRKSFSVNACKGNKNKSIVDEAVDESAFSGHKEL